jgi:hypothetical protein
VTKQEAPQGPEGFDSVVHETKRDSSWLFCGFGENRDRIAIGKVAAMFTSRGSHQLKTRQFIQGDVERVTKVFELLLLGPKEMLLGMIENIVEGEQHGLDGLVTLDPPVLRLVDSAQAVGDAGAEMKNRAVLTMGAAEHASS